MSDPIQRDPDGIDPDALTTDPDARIRQLSLVLYSTRVAAEKARTVYARAIKRMRAAEIQLARAVNERRAAQLIMSGGGRIRLDHPPSQPAPH